MKRHVQYFYSHGGDTPREAMGSDGVLMVDGRVRLDTVVDWANEQAHALRFVQPHYSHFQIRAGRLTEPRPLSPVTPLRKADNAE